MNLYALLGTLIAVVCLWNARHWIRDPSKADWPGIALVTATAGTVLTLWAFDLAPPATILLVGVALGTATVLAGLRVGVWVAAFGGGMSFLSAFMTGMAVAPEPERTMALMTCIGAPAAVAFLVARFRGSRWLHTRTAIFAAEVWLLAKGPFNEGWLSWVVFAGLVAMAAACRPQGSVARAVPSSQEVEVG